MTFYLYFVFTDTWNTATYSVTFRAMGLLNFSFRLFFKRVRLKEGAVQQQDSSTPACTLLRACLCCKYSASGIPLLASFQEYTWNDSDNTNITPQ